MTDTNAPAIDWTEPPPRGYVRDARGNLVHESNVRPRDRDTDAVIDRIHAFGEDLSAQIWRYRTHTMDDVYGLADRIVNDYGAALGGRRGNITLTSIDGCRRVTLAKADYIDVGPEIVAAQALLEECLAEWTKGASRQLQALLRQAFEPAADGRLSVTKLMALRRIRIEDPRWPRFQDAIADAMRPTGRAQYIRLHRRDTPAHRWVAIPLTIAAAERPRGAPDATDAEGMLRASVARQCRAARASGVCQGRVREIVAEACRVRPASEPATGE